MNVRLVEPFIQKQHLVIRNYKMKKLIIYFHGFNSSPKTEKVDRLKSAFPDDYVYAFPINIDPDIADKELEIAIDFALINHLNEEIQVLFVGTSLGAWWANRFGELYHCPVLLINPCKDPAKTLGLIKFMPMKHRPEQSVYFIAKHDEIMQHTYDITWPNLFLYDSPEVKHRFNGPEFDDVIEVIRQSSSIFR